MPFCAWKQAVSGQTLKTQIKLFNEQLDQSLQNECPMFELQMIYSDNNNSD